MLQNYLTIAIRNLKRQFTYSAINILGLAVGMACSLVIFLYVFGEWSHDRHFRNADRIYRIGVSFFNIGQFANGPEILKENIEKDFDGIEAMTHFQRNGSEILTVNGEVFKESVYFVDSSFFNVFSYDFSFGDYSTALKRPQSVVVTESIARKYFKETNVIGKTIEIGKAKEPFTVTGIVRDDGSSSHMKNSIWVSLKEDGLSKKYWTSAAVYNYVLLRENVTQADLNSALDRLIATKVYPQSGAAQSKISLENYRKDENSVKFIVHPLKDIYLKSRLSLELSPGGNETNMLIFAVVALFILILAAVNFINLSTARATRRAKEVGIRKSLGTSKARLVSQFLFESVLICLLSLVVALCFAEIFTFVFFWVTGQQLPMRIWDSPLSIAGVIFFSVVVGLLSGIYPALYLTGFEPVKVLKGNLHAGGSTFFRNALVVFQFSISIALIICSAVIIRQLVFMQTKDLGFNQQNVVTIDNIGMLKNSALTWRDQLLRQPEVLNASLHGGEPGSKAIMSFYTYQTPDMENQLTIHTYFGDANFLNVMGFKLLKGRDFNPDLASDTSSIILNEAAVKALNLGENPLDAVINKTQKVVGVVSDFHWESLRNEIAPLAIVLQNEKVVNYSSYQLGLKVKSGQLSNLLKTAEAQWKQQVPDEPFQYHFLDDNFGAIVKKEEVLAKAISFFTILAILISCLGLFGLAAYMTDQRTKEIGIRKVLGATVASIILLLTRQFTLLVIVAMAIAIPASWFVADWWLTGFAYRTEIALWIFLAGGVLGLVISYLTVAFHSIKASRTNPAETLKWE